MTKQTETMQKQNSLTPFDYTLTIIGGKWKMKIINPPKVEHSLTPRGKSLMPILEEMCRWGIKIFSMK
jgi:DNA-binding HxlR family transcriptional regulator